MSEQWFRFVFISTLLIHVTHGWSVEYSPDEDIRVQMEHIVTINLTISGVGLTENQFPAAAFHIAVPDDGKHMISLNNVIPMSEISPDGSWSGEIEITGVFLGETSIFVQLVDGTTVLSSSLEILRVIVIREARAIDTVFTVCVALFVSILYINFGAALDISVMKSILKKPIGPIIGFCGQFVIMPLLSYGLGYALFPTQPTLALGLFFTGVSPGGGASNMWTVLLKGNINLSITMTAISTFAAFGMIPLWLFTLGTTIFDKANLGVPYGNISTFAFSLIIPLGIGLLIQRFLPRVAELLVRILKPLSALLILFIVIFAIVANLYLFELFSWEILVAGLALPWLGYALSWLIALACKQNAADSITIALETGIQNTGIAIFLLRFALTQPSADLTTVVPVAVAIMTPFPLLAIYLFQKVKECLNSRNTEIFVPTSSTVQLKEDA